MKTKSKCLLIIALTISILSSCSNNNTRKNYVIERSTNINGETTKDKESLSSEKDNSKNKDDNESSKDLSKDK